MVVLLKPPGLAFSSAPPLHLLALAAYLRQRGQAVRVLDLAFPEDEAALRALGGAPAPLLFGITSTTPEFPAAIRLVGRLKARFPGVPVVLGGIHATALGEHALAEAGADLAVLGEGEQTLLELTEALAAGGPGADLQGIPGLVMQRDGHSVRTARRAPPADLDALPFPAWDLVPTERYFSRPWHLMRRRKRTAVVLTSRGCPFGCTFCASHATLGRRFRGRSPAHVVDEIEALHRQQGAEEFLFIDDNFTYDRERAAAICDEILRRGLDISWRTPNGVRLDTLDPPLVELMKQSGCYLLGFGIESGDPDVLRGVHKGLDLDRVADTLAMVRAAGLLTFGYFILGLPGESYASALRTVRFAAGSELDLAHFGLFAPYPGSADFQRLRHRPEVLDWERYLFFKPFPVSDVPPEQLKALLRFAYPHFFLRPRRLRLLARELGPHGWTEVARVLAHYLG